MTLPPQLGGLAEEINKDLSQEFELANLNDLLAPVEAELSTGLSEPARPILFILGAPRSGTTLTSQLLASTGAFGVTTNFVAKFWKAPALGITLQRLLGDQAGSSSFQSERGRTSGSLEPHEFGYFWSRWFDLGQDTHALSPALLARVDEAGLKRSLAAMEKTAGKPMMFKNNTWFAFQAHWLAQAFPTGLFIACERDPFFIAQSILLQRRALGDENRWWSMRPSAYRALTALPVLEQVAAQTVEIVRDMSRSLEQVPSDRLVYVPYRGLCSHPAQIVQEIFRRLERLGYSPSVEGLAATAFGSTDEVRLNSTEAAQLAKHLKLRFAT